MQRQVRAMPLRYFDSAGRRGFSRLCINHLTSFQQFPLLGFPLRSLAHGQLLKLFNESIQQFLWEVLNPCG